MIAQGQHMGIGKRALLEDYYLDEFLVICEEWAILGGADPEEEVVRYDSPEDFFFHK